MGFSWNKKKVLVTGGASFIGSHLVDALVERGAEVVVIDDLSSGSLDHIQGQIDANAIEFVHADLRETARTKEALRKIDILFHLAADHGGRGYVDTHQAGPASNLYLDGLVLWEGLRAGVDKIVFASSGCVYPNHLQNDADQQMAKSEMSVEKEMQWQNL